MSKAIADKVDMGSITVKLSNDEKLNVMSIIQELGCKEPNMVTDVYKNRAGSLTDVKIFRHFDYSTCRMEDLFMTNSYYEWIDGYRIYAEELEESNLLVRKENYDESNRT